MSELTREQVVEYLSNLNIMELTSMVEELEEKWGVKAASGGGMMMMAPGEGGGAEAAEEQTEFDVILEDFGAKKINVIKVVRALTGLGLKEAKAMVEDTPSTIKEAVSKEEAEDVVKQLEEAGAKAKIK